MRGSLPEGAGECSGPPGQAGSVPSPMRGFPGGVVWEFGSGTNRRWGLVAGLGWGGRLEPPRVMLGATPALSQALLCPGWVSSWWEGALLPTSPHKGVFLAFRG